MTHSYTAPQSWELAYGPLDKYIRVSFLKLEQTNIGTFIGMQRVQDYTSRMLLPIALLYNRLFSFHFLVLSRAYLDYQKTKFKMARTMSAALSFLINCFTTTSAVVIFFGL